MARIWRSWVFILCWWECNDTASLESSLVVPRNVKIQLSYDPPIPILDMNPNSRYEETWKHIYIKNSANVHRSIIYKVKMWKQPKCPSTFERLNKMWYTPKMGCYLNIKTIEIPIQEAKTWLILTHYTKWKKIVPKITLYELIRVK